jgi:hypothetical protein
VIARATAVLALLALSGSVAGCGGDDETESSPVEVTELALTLDADGPGGEESLTAELTCPAANAAPTACSAVEELPEDPAAPVPADTPCTEIFGGPDVLTIEGTLKGDQVDAELTRANGCEIERFDRFLPLLEVLFPEYQPGESVRP